MAARAATHPSFTLQVLAKELAEEHTRLDALDTGEPTTSIHTVFSWSYHQLSTPTARMFRLLGLHPGPDIALPAATQLADLPSHQARKALGELTRAHLLTEHTPSRYSFHDLLRAYATQLTTTHDPHQDQQAALSRLLDHYLNTTTAAMDTLYPAEQHRRPRTPPVMPTPQFTDPAPAQHWLDTERANLTAITAYCAAHGWHTYTTQLATTLFRYLDVGGHYPDALSIHTYSLHAARHTSDRPAEALALTNLGVIHEQQSRYQQATDHHQLALAVACEIGDRGGEARALTHLGIIGWRHGPPYGQATDYLQQALTLFRELEDRVGEATALTFLGAVRLRQCHYEQAADYLQQALALTCEVGDRVGEVRALTGLGIVYQHQGHYQQAADHSHQALTICRDIGYRANEVQVLTNLGTFYQWQGHYQTAADYHQQALALCREIGDRASEPQVLNGLGEVNNATGQCERARIQHIAALTAATELGDRYEQARAHHGLAHTHRTTGELDQARYHGRQARTLFANLGVPDTDNVRTHLTGLD